jgi:diguanylate cyclase (GGDEF)-like protein
MHLYYAVTVAGIALFFFAYHGLAPRYLWPHHAWLTSHVAPLAVLLGLAGGLPLVERLLDVRALYPRLAQVMWAGALLAVAVALLFVLGVLSYRQAHIVATVMGPTPVVLAVRVAWVRWRQQGDPAAPYLFAGWGVYLLGVAVMAALLRGWVDSDPYTQHAFQLASMFEAMMWLRVLGLRNEQARAVAERAARERELLQTLAYTDPLTGLPNRRGLEQALQAALPSAGARHVLAVYLLDLDGFKAVNDRLGHEAGDTLLRQVAQRLRLELRHRDVVARLGGDEFVVLARDLPGEPEAWQLGRKLVAAFKQAFEVDGTRCHVGLTVGFALAPLDGQDAAALLRRADAAMYAGKQSGKGTVRRGGASVGLADVY